MKEHNLTVPQGKRREIRPGSGGSKPRAKRPNEYWGIDMTKFMLERLGRVYLVVVLDWYTEKIVGWNLFLRSRSSEWKEAFNMTLNNQFPDGVRDNGLKPVSDNGCPIHILQQSQGKRRYLEDYENHKRGGRLDK
jgi:transposase InsO family protein